MVNAAVPSSNQPSTQVAAPGTCLRLTLCIGAASIFFVGGYELLQFIPSSINYLAIIPENTIPFLWTLFTASYIERYLPGVICSSVVLVFSGLLLWPGWGNKKFLKFIFLVNLITSILAFAAAMALYYITSNEIFLTTPLSGFQAMHGGFLVAWKQQKPNSVKLLPLAAIILYTLLAFINPVVRINMGTSVAGMFVGWIYLRYFQTGPTSQASWEDLGDDFSFSSFFPDNMRGVTKPLSCLFDKVFGSRAGQTLLPISDPSKNSTK